MEFYLITDNLETSELSRLVGLDYRGVTSRGHITLIHQEMMVVWATQVLCARIGTGRITPASLFPSTQSHVNNNKEIRRSFQTDSRKLAIKRARACRVQFESVVDKLMSQSDNISDRVRQIVDSLLNLPRFAILMSL